VGVTDILYSRATWFLHPNSKIMLTWDVNNNFQKNIDKIKKMTKLQECKPLEI
jgi:hypothetical protein